MRYNETDEVDVLTYSVRATFVVHTLLLFYYTHDLISVILKASIGYICVA